MTSTLTRPAGIYGRQSQAKKTSVADQIRLGGAHCERESWPIHREYSDLVSASPFGNKPRGGWPELVADVVAGKLGVIVLWDASRGDRTLESWAAFLASCKATGTLIYALAHERLYDLRRPRDWRDLAVEGVDAQYESEKRSVDVRRGIEGAALAGKQHARPAYGFSRRYNPDDRKDFTEVPNDKIQHAVEIIERIAKRDPLITIVRDLNRRGVDGPNGLPWQRKSARRIATNPAYIGYRTQKVKNPDGVVTVNLHRGNWDAVVSEDVFYRAQAVLSAPDRRASPPGATKYLLSYLITAPCDFLIQGIGARAGRTPRYRCIEDSCTGIDMKAADEYVTSVVLKRLSKKDARSFFARGKAELGMARAELARLNAKLEEARTAFDDDVITAVALGRREKKLMPQIDDAQRRVASFTSDDAVAALLGDEDFTAETARPRWDALSVAARRAVITALFKEIRLGPNTRKLTRWNTDLDRLEAAKERITLTWRGRTGA